MTKIVSIIALFAGLAGIPDATRAVEPLLDPTTFQLSKPYQEASVLHIFNNEDFLVEWTAQAFLWSQDISGKEMLEPSTEIGISPLSFRLEPRSGKDVQLRYLGVEPTEKERTFRVVLSVSPVGQGGIIVSYSHSLPVFVAPRISGAVPEIRLSSEQDKLVLSVSNHGNGHDFATKIFLEGEASDGLHVFSLDRSGWYLLPDSRVMYRATLSAEDCSRSTHVKATVKFRSGATAYANLPDRILCSASGAYTSEFEDLKSAVISPTPAHK